MSLAQFIGNLEGLNGGHDFPKDLLKVNQNFSSVGCVVCVKRPTGVLFTPVTECLCEHLHKHLSGTQQC